MMLVDQMNTVDGGEMTQQDYLDMAALNGHARMKLNQIQRKLDEGMDTDTRVLLNAAFDAIARLQDRLYEQAMPRSLIEVLDDDAFVPIASAYTQALVNPI
jgi:hypothetical protein